MLKNNVLVLVDLEVNKKQLLSISNKKHPALLQIFGKYNLIDLVLSNLIKAELHDINLILESMDYNIFDYVKNGKYWNLDKKRYSLKYIFSPSEDLNTSHNINAIYNFLRYIDESKFEYVLITNVATANFFDYDKAVSQAAKEKKPIYSFYADFKNTPAFKDVKIMSLSKDKTKVASYGINSGITDRINYDLGIFLIRTDLFIRLIKEAVMSNSNQKIQNFISNQCRTLEIEAVQYEGYVGNISNPENYYKTNLEILTNPTIDLTSLDLNIHTHNNDFPPTFYSDVTNIKNSLVSSGCYINGNVKNTVISQNVTIHRFSTIENCIIMANCKIKSNAVLKNVILCEDTVISANKQIINDQEDYPIVVGYKSVI